MPRICRAIIKSKGQHIDEKRLDWFSQFFPENNSRISQVDVYYLFIKCYSKQIRCMKLSGNDNLSDKYTKKNDFSKWIQTFAGQCTYISILLLLDETFISCLAMSKNMMRDIKVSGYIDFVWFLFRGLCLFFLVTSGDYPKKNHCSPIFENFFQGLNLPGFLLYLFL